MGVVRVSVGRHQQPDPLHRIGPFALPRTSTRVRELVRADLLPDERATADAAVMTAWLSPAQRARYAPSLRAVDDPDAFVERLADERRVVLMEGADPVPDELEDAARAEREARQTPLRVLEGVLLVGALACFVGIVLLSMRADVQGLTITPEGVPELAAALVSTVAASAVIGAAATRRRDRAMLSWAVNRPGQLGRGIPLRRGLQVQSAGPSLARSLGAASLFALGILAAVAGAAVLLITLVLRSEQDYTTLGLALLVGGVVAFLLSVLLFRWYARRLERIVRRARAVQWFGPGPNSLEGPSAGREESLPAVRTGSMEPDSTRTTPARTTGAVTPNEDASEEPMDWRDELRER